MHALMFYVFTMFYVYGSKAADKGAIISFLDLAIDFVDQAADEHFDLTGHKVLSFVNVLAKTGLSKGKGRV